MPDFQDPVMTLIFCATLMHGKDLKVITCQTVGYLGTLGTPSKAGPLHRSLIRQTKHRNATIQDTNRSVQLLKDAMVYWRWDGGAWQNQWCSNPRVVRESLHRAGLCIILLSRMVWNSWTLTILWMKTLRWTLTSLMMEPLEAKAMKESVRGRI